MDWIRHRWDELLPTQRVAFVLAPLAFIAALYVKANF